MKNTPENDSRREKKTTDSIYGGSLRFRGKTNLVREPLLNQANVCPKNRIYKLIFLISLSISIIGLV